MASATRHENGRWEIVPEEGDHATFNAWLARFFNALDPVFVRAKQASEFEFILCLLPVHGMGDSGYPHLGFERSRYQVASSSNWPYP